MVIITATTAQQLLLFRCTLADWQQSAKSAICASVPHQIRYKNRYFRINTVNSCHIHSFIHRSTDVVCPIPHLREIIIYASILMLCVDEC